MAQFFGRPENKVGLFNGLREADMGGGEFIVQLYGSAGRAPRNSFSHFYNPLTKEGFVFPIPSTNGLQVSSAQGLCDLVSRAASFPSPGGSAPAAELALADGGRDFSSHPTPT